MPIKSLVTAKLEKAYSEYDCTKQGHVWIERDTGLLYSRSNTRKRELLPVFCRHCGKIENLEAHGKTTAAAPGDTRVNEYQGVASFLQVQAIAIGAFQSKLDPNTGPSPMVAN
jgi:hypothetical protein